MIRRQNDQYSENFSTERKWQIENVVCTVASVVIIGACGITYPVKIYVSICPVYFYQLAYDGWTRGHSVNRRTVLVFMQK